MGIPAGATAGAEQHRHIANAVKAFGTVVTVEPEEFLKILKLQGEPLVVTAEGGFFKKTQQYLTSYKGLAFFTKSPEPLVIPVDAVVIAAEAIRVPD